MRTVNVKSLGQCPYLISVEPTDLIGRGSYAEVRVAYDKNEKGKMLAAKIFDLEDGRKYESALKQLSVVCSFPQHPNLVDYKRIKITSKHRLYIIMELCEKSVRNEIDEERRKDKGYFMEQGRIWQFIKQFCEGYKVLNGNNIVHRDIKPDNILKGKDGNYKIADFGLADIITEYKNQHHKKSPNAKGSLCFMAPQILPSSNKHINQQYTLSNSSLVDVYSFGVTLYYICFGRYPYIGCLKSYNSLNQLISDILNLPLKFPSHAPYSSKLLSLISQMLQKDVKKRCCWQYIFYSLMQISEQKLVKMGNQEMLPSYNLRVVEISDAFLKNLSALDGDLYQSLSNQSLVIIDHVEADIISKRQTIFYCDRIYSRFNIILQKCMLERRIRMAFDKFRNKLLKLNYLRSRCVQRQFQECYKKVENSEFMKLVVSKKYQGIHNLLKQDFKSLQEEIRQKFQQNDELQCMQKIKIQLYQLCPIIIESLYELKMYQQCRQIDQLQKWLSGTPETILHKARKNQNIIKEFNRQNFGISCQKLREVISKQYLFKFTQIDRRICKK